MCCRTIHLNLLLDYLHGMAVRTRSSEQSDMMSLESSIRRVHKLPTQFVMMPAGIVRGTLHPQRVIFSGKRGLLGETKRNPVEAGICQRSSAGS